MSEITESLMEQETEMFNSKDDFPVYISVGHPSMPIEIDLERFSDLEKHDVFDRDQLEYLKKTESSEWVMVKNTYPQGYVRKLTTEELKEKNDK